MITTPFSPSALDAFFQHPDRDQPDHIHGAHQIDLDHLVEKIDGHGAAVPADHLLGRADPRTVDRHVNPAKGCHGLVDGRLHAGFVRHVGFAEDRRLAQLCDQPLAPVGVKIENRRLAPLCDHLPDRSFPEAGCSAGDDGYTIFQLHCSVLLFVPGSDVPGVVVNSD